MRSILREVEEKQRSALNAKLDRLEAVEEATMRCAAEEQYELANLFASPRLSYDMKDRFLPSSSSSSDFERLMRRIRGNAIALRQQQQKKRKEQRIRAAYGPPSTAQRFTSVV